MYRENELYHHGILGMKWGVRRYQNKDGTLTAKGRARFRQVSGDERLVKRNTKQAVKILNSNRKTYDSLASRSEILAEKAGMKADKQTTKTEEALYKNNKPKAEKHLAKERKYIAEQAAQTKRAKAFLEVSDVINQKIDKIKSGELKAGRDFIVQNDYNVYPIVLPVPGGLLVGGGGYREQTLIEK